MAPPSPSDLDITRRLDETESTRLRVQWLHNGSVRVESTSWVGVVRFSSFELRVVPKLVGGNLGILEMLEVTRGAAALRSIGGARTIATEGTNLLDLVAWLFLNGTQDVVEQGLLQDYVVREETLSALRGRLLLKEHVRRRFNSVTQLECRFDEFETDIFENQLVATALGICRRHCTLDHLRRKAGRLHVIFEEAAPTTLDLIPAEDDLSFHRRNEYYREAMTWGSLLLRGQGFDSLYSTGNRDVFAFLIDMNVLFEELVAVVLRRALEGLPVSLRTQERNRSILFNEKSGRSFAAIRPDFLVRKRTTAGTQWLPLDAKYKLYEKRKVSMPDVYQTFFYAQAYAPRERIPVAFILHPTEEAATETRLFVQGYGTAPKARIVGLGILIPTILKELREQESVGGEISRLRKLVMKGLETPSTTGTAAS